MYVQEKTVCVEFGALCVLRHRLRGLGTHSLWMSRVPLHMKLGRMDENQIHIISFPQGPEETRSFKLSQVKPCFHLNRRKNGSSAFYEAVHIYSRSGPVTDKMQSSSKHNSKPLLYKGLHHQDEFLDAQQFLLMA